MDHGGGFKVFQLTCLFVEGLCELVDRGGNLQSLVEDLPLSLQANVLGPFDESSQISLRLNITA